MKEGRLALLRDLLPTKPPTHPLSPEMIIPVRCFTCGKVIGNKYETYAKLLGEDVDNGKAMDNLGLKRYCCRRMILTHVDLVDKVRGGGCAGGRAGGEWAGACGRVQAVECTLEDVWNREKRARYFIARVRTEEPELSWGDAGKPHQAAQRGRLEWRDRGALCGLRVAGLRWGGRLRGLQPAAAHGASAQRAAVPS